MYIGDTRNHRVRKITVSTGIITTIAGTGTAGYSGDGGAATSAMLNDPRDIATDASGDRLTTIDHCTFNIVIYLGNEYICDCVNSRIRMVAVATRFITTIAGTGTLGYSGDGGAATSAAMYYPSGIALDSSGN